MLAMRIKQNNAGKSFHFWCVTMLDKWWYCFLLLSLCQSVLTREIHVRQDTGICKNLQD